MPPVGFGNRLITAVAIGYKVNDPIYVYYRTNMKKPINLLLTSTIFLAACTSQKLLTNPGTSPEVTNEAYVAGKDTDGIVLLDIKWSRKWGCGKFENAQLIAIGFDKFPLSKKTNREPEDFLINNAKLLGRVAPPQVFVNYAFQIPPGRYALSSYVIKVAESASKTNHWVASRNDLLKDGKPLGGTFTVAPGEIAYIGNFYLDCTNGPSLWRYYTKGQNEFKEQLSEYQAKYPFLDLHQVKYRLFDTTTLGHKYQLR